MTKAKGQQVRMPPRREEIDWEDRTTVMVRNIPSVYTQRDLLTELDTRGWKGTYDFFYLPFDLNKKTNMGYCFMNFKDPSLAEACHVALDGAQLARGEGRGRKRLQVVPAVTQGYQANLEHFQHSAVLNHHRSEHGPIFLRDDNAPLARRREARSNAPESRLETPPRMLPRPPLSQPPTLPPTLPQPPLQPPTLPQPPLQPPLQPLLQPLQPPLAPTQPPPPLESLLPSAITTLSLSPIPPGFSQPMMYVELCRIGVGYLVDFLHLDHFAHEAIVNLTTPQGAVAAAQVLSGVSLGGSAPLMVGIARVQGCGANIVHYATRGILAEEAKKAQKENQKILKPVARVPVKSYEYTCPAFDMTAQPPTTASVSTEVSDEDEAQKICEPVAQRVEERAPRFASLGITLEEGAAEPYAATDSAAPAQAGSASWPVAVDLTPPRTSAQPGKDEPQASQRRAVHADMERALHAGFPSLLSSPACNFMPSSRGSSSDSRLPRSATPPLSGPQSQCGTSPQCDSNAQDSNAHDAGSGGTATPPAPQVAVSKTARSGFPPRPVATSS
jgi:hypothetical protein